MTPPIHEMKEWLQEQYSVEQVGVKILQQQSMGRNLDMLPLTKRETLAFVCDFMTDALMDCFGFGLFEFFDSPDVYRKLTKFIKKDYLKKIDLSEETSDDDPLDFAPKVIENEMW